MSTNKENLEGLVSKLKEQGINAGKEEKKRIVEEAREKASAMLADAEKQSREIIEEAQRKARQFEMNAEASLRQASRDMIESTRMEVLRYLKSIFRQNSDRLMTEAEYSRELLKAVIDILPGQKTISLNKKILSDMENYLLNQGMKEQVILKPLGENNARIVIDSNGNGDVHFVLTSEDIEKGMFSLLNDDLTRRIRNGQEVNHD
jgi:V/A-type H+-transporting ATPase subunit E